MSILDREFIPQTTAERVAAAIRDGIMRGQVPPGTQLHEKSLREELGVSRNTIREALRMLTTDGLARHDAYRGVSVARLSEADVHDIFRARRSLELAGAGAAVANESSIGDQLEDARDGFEAAVDRKDWAGAFEADLKLHSTIVAATGSLRLEQFFVAIFNELRLGYFVVGGFETESLPQDREEHRAIVEALTSREPKKIRALLTDHLTRSEELLLQLMEDAAEPAEQDVAPVIARTAAAGDSQS